MGATDVGLFDMPVSDQRFFAPEVVQTSAMDCGPAALKSILEGFNIPVSYGRLREACQTDVDGTSINTVEDIAVQLGLQAEQVMLPADHLALPEAQALPAIVVVQRPSGLTHFLVVWSRVGNYLQVMDPATGRRWPSWKNFQNEIYIHTFPVPADSWREWAGSEGLLAPLRRRQTDLQIEASRIQHLIEDALADPTWRSLATLDAATRMITSLVRARGLPPGDAAARVLEEFYRLNLAGPLPKMEREGAASEPQPGASKTLMIPSMYWSALPAVESDAQAAGAAPLDRLLLRGAVLVRILGRRAAEVRLDEAPQVEEIHAPVADIPTGAQAVRPTRLPPDLQAALQEPSYKPEAAVWSALRQDGLITPGILALSLFLATLGVLIEALLFQGMIRIGASLNLTSQKLLAALALLGFIASLLVLELPISATVLRMGRRLEARLRIAFLEKIPRLGDRYFRSRLTSDMTQRAYDLRALRGLPSLGTGLLRTFFQLILTTIGVIWLDPRSAPLAIIGTAFFVGVSLLTRPLLEERDLRLRTHTGALSRFYLDALLGLTPVRTHGAERAMRRQHEMQLYEWVRTGRDAYTMGAILQAVGAFMYSVFAILILFNYLMKGGQANEILLLFYWTLNLPALGQSLADSIQQYPMQRNMILRLLEPLSAPDEEQVWSAAASQADTDRPSNLSLAPSAAGLGEGAPQAAGDQVPVALRNEEEIGVGGSGVSIDIVSATLQAGGHVILDGIDLKISAGEHVAIVGPSGAGKSSLVGLLLGWHHPSLGSISVDGVPLDGERLQELRRHIAWVDPAVQIWNRSLYDNMRYGVENRDPRPIGEVIAAADLYDVLERLPEGLKTDLGESGGLVSGGEGQRVRLGRAMLRGDVRLVVLDEPFRGLDREKRRDLLRKARQHWSGQTMLCVTHDIGETQNFPRVLVIENGRLVEDASPQALLADPNSRYHAILDAEAAVRHDLWEGTDWRRMTIARGILEEEE